MSDTDIQALIEELGSNGGAARHKARHALVALGAAPVPALTEALASGNHNARWGAAKALGQIADAATAPALALALEDEDSDIRWLAATALVALGEPGLLATLRAFVANDLEGSSHHAAHHVLHDFAHAGRADVKPVLDALEGPAPREETPLKAGKLLIDIGDRGRAGA